MYPADHLKRLELRKLRAQLSIALHRQQCIAAGQQLAGTIDEWEAWRGRIMQWKSMLKFAPGIFGLFKLFRKKKPRSPEDSDGFGEAPPQRGKMATALSWLTTGLRAYNTFRGRR
jgi:hypothetical protein